MAVGSNRCVTGRRPSDENHVVRLRQSAENRQSSEGHVAEQVVFDDTAWMGAQALAPPGSRKKIWDKKKSPI